MPSARGNLSCCADDGPANNAAAMHETTSKAFMAASIAATTMVARLEDTRHAGCDGDHRPALCKPRNLSPPDHEAHQAGALIGPHRLVGAAVIPRTKSRLERRRLE